ncbi:MAG: hypothetical protein QM667_09215 [Asticcacaulis sp.]
MKRVTGLGLGVLAAGLVLGLSAFSPEPAQAGCSDDDGRCKALMQRVKNLKQRDPEAEAKAAAARGDFRLGRMFYYGDPIIVAASHLPGVECRIWTRNMVGKEHTSQDVIMPGDSEHKVAAERFLKRYNQTLLRAPSFPYRDVCRLEGGKYTASYDGPVTTADQAARSGDVSKLEALSPSAEAVREADAFGVTPLGWAMVRKDTPMAVALIAHGADPDDMGAFTGDVPSLLGQFILKQRYDEARALREKGAKLYGDTGLCERPEEPMYMFASPPSIPQEAQETKADVVAPVGECSWAGLLLRRKQYDLLEYLLKTQPKTHDPNALHIEVLDNEGDVANAFKGAVVAGDQALATRLFPYVGDDPDYPGDWLGWLYRHQQYGFLADRVMTRHRDNAYSPVQADLWGVAFDAKQYQTFALLWDYGHHLNLLTKTQLAACRAAVAAGDQPKVFDLCIRASFDAYDQVLNLIKGGDTQALAADLAQRASLREDYKVRLSELVVMYGTPSMLGLLTGDQTAKNRHMIYGAGDEVRFHSLTRRMYDGPLKAEIDAYALPRLTYERPGTWRGHDMLTLAIKRNDPEMLRAVLKAGYTGLAAQLNATLGFGNSLDRYIPGFVSIFFDQVDSETYPSAPADPAVAARIETTLPLIVEGEGPQALEETFGYVTQLGWNDLAQKIVDAGFDPRNARDPAKMWFYFLGFNSVCKPSTARLMLRNGLNTRFYTPGDTNYAGSHILWMAAAGCRDGETIGALIRDGGIGVNEMIDGYGNTALDEADRRGNEATVRVLKSLGGQPGKVLYADVRKQRRKEALADGMDPDIWSGYEE